jgi:ATP-dependent DNA helicase DinG
LAITWHRRYYGGMDDTTADPPFDSLDQILLPDAPVLIADHQGATLLSQDGELESMDKQAAYRRGRDRAPILCHANATARYLGHAPFPCFDILELFAFVRPAQFAAPTPRGLADACHLLRPETSDDAAFTLLQIARILLDELTKIDGDAYSIAWAMARAGWSWGSAVLAVLEKQAPKKQPGNLLEGLRVWTKLKEWEETAPEPPAGHLDIGKSEVSERLHVLLGPNAEDRPQQLDYALATKAAFAPTEHEAAPVAVIAEAGTGVGKTLGYIAPASVWAEKNEGPVWVSTFTRNLQRQLDGELDRLYPDPIEKRLRAVIRKGRENYLCLLNFEQALGTGQANQADIIILGLVARWALASRNGDMIGGDFPAWLTDLLGRQRTVELTDTRGECIYSACSHYGKCYIEKSVRRARRARIVVANHALVMIQAALGGDDPDRPTRYVFDEGHHLFDAADSAFSSHLTGIETSELRRWIMGAEGRRSSRARGLKARIEDLIADNDEGVGFLTAILAGSRILPNQGWQERIAGGNPHGPAEHFLALARQQVYARDKSAAGPYDLETAVHPSVDGLAEAGSELAHAFGDLSRPIRKLVQILSEKLDQEADDLDSATRKRIEAVCRSLEHRGIQQINGWRSMLEALSNETPEDFIDFLSVERYQGRDFDTGLHRHWVDASKPFAEMVIKSSHGTLITSATLRDGAGEADPDNWERNWDGALSRTGLVHLSEPADRAAVLSPFDYPAQTRIFVVSDVDKNNIEQLAAAYRELMIASHGGALGLFTSIARLKSVHGRLVESPEMKKFMLLAQHADPLDTGTLVDIFRAEENACLLGTDAVRDGIDVPGRALRMVIYERVPWPRPSILHKTRKSFFEAKGNGLRYDDFLTRLKLKQAYGRLVRWADDHGVFVILDRAMPSRLKGAFPDGVEVERIGLAEAISKARNFLAQS